ncbi:hypothetical protein MMC13_001714 [Lambiella insularis]|nr:hypothetical protein [Lambiella insularis]
MALLSEKPSNQAAYLVAPDVKTLEVRSAPYTRPRSGEIVIKNAAIAVNPIDWVLQDIGNFMFSWIKYPLITGSDVAGEVVELGNQVTRFNIGDRVFGHCVGVDKQRNTSAEGGFQLYTVLLAHMTSPIPAKMSYETASVIPLVDSLTIKIRANSLGSNNEYIVTDFAAFPGLSTAACGLFQKDQLALQYPSTNPTPTGKTLLIWGGSTSVGCNAIQLGFAAGYEVISTASPKNFDLVKKLGAVKAFDYNSPTVIADITRILEGRTVAGALSIGKGAADACMAILHNCKGNKVLSMATYPVPSPPPESLVLLKTAYSFVSWSVVNWFKSKAWGIRKDFIFGTSLAFNGVGKAVYEDYLPQAFAEGSFVAAPDPHVVGKGLEYIQPALDYQKKGVSAQKVVVSL